MAAIVLTILLSSLITFIVTVLASISTSFSTLPSRAVRIFYARRPLQTTHRSPSPGSDTPTAAHVEFPFLATLGRFATDAAFVVRNALSTALRYIGSAINKLTLAIRNTAAPYVRQASQTLLSKLRINLEALFGRLKATLVRVWPLYGASAIPGSAAKDSYLKLDIVEDLSSNTTIISIDTPGIRKEDIDLSIVANTLTVLAKRERANTGSSGRQVVREEKAYGVFERKLALPAGTQVRDLKAHLANGVLTVSYPRTSEHAPEKVAISSD